MICCNLSPDGSEYFSFNCAIHVKQYYFVLEIIVHDLS